MFTFYKLAFISTYNPPTKHLRNKWWRRRFSSHHTKQILRPSFIYIVYKNKNPAIGHGCKLWEIRHKLANIPKVKY